MVNFTLLNLLESLSQLNPIGLEAMEGAELMNRLDQKFLVLSDWIPELVPAVQRPLLHLRGQWRTDYAIRESIYRNSTA